MSMADIKERLGALPALRREVTRTKRRLALLRERQKQSQGEEMDLAFIMTEAALRRYLTEAQEEEAALLRYIHSIEDASTRELFMLRYYDGIRSWQRIAFLAGEHDESYVRRKVNAEIRRASAYFPQPQRRA